MIITLDIHYVYCIYVLIIVVSYIAIDDDDDNDRLLSVIEEREREVGESDMYTHTQRVPFTGNIYIYIYREHRFYAIPAPFSMMRTR